MTDYNCYNDQKGRILQSPDCLFQAPGQTPAHPEWNPLPFEALKNALPGTGLAR